MRIITGIIATLILSIGLLSSCSGDVSASLGQTVTLRPGQTVSINGENLKITFVGVTEDSRCPIGAT